MKVGIFKASVVAVNPSYQKINTLTGSNLKKEIVYVGKDHTKLVFMLKEATSGEYFYLTFNLSKEPAVTKNGNYLYGSNKGYVFAKDKNEEVDLTFAKKLVKGEDALFTFWRFYGQRDKYNIEAILKGSTAGLLKDTEVGFLAYIEVDLNGKRHQKILNSRFISAEDLPRFESSYSSAYIKQLLSTKQIHLESWQEFIVAMNNPKYPFPHYFTLLPLRPYCPELNPIESSKIKL